MVMVTWAASLVSRPAGDAVQSDLPGCYPESTGWADLNDLEIFDSRPDRGPQEMIDAVYHDLGLDSARRVRYRDLPDLTGLHHELEI